MIFRFNEPCSSKIWFIKIGSSKIWFIEIGSLKTVFSAMSIYPKLNLQLAGVGGFFVPAIIKWRYLIVTNRFKSVCLNHRISFPVCAFEGFTSSLYVLIPCTTSLRCRPAKAHSYPPKLGQVWVNPELRMSLETCVQEVTQEVSAAVIYPPLFIPIEDILASIQGNAIL